MSDSRRSSLAKLMATENISVEHKNIPTAYFDTKDRVLGLPIWKNASKDVYDLLVGHEVSHALYTPVDWIKGAESIDPDNFGAVKSYLNVIEDARIEKLIKRKFPGLKKNMFKGYAELLERDFFGTDGREFSSYKFIDRINLHFKVGSHVDIPFTSDEKDLVNRIEKLESFEDVVSIVKEIYDGEKSELDKEQESANSNSDDTENSDDEMDSLPQESETNSDDSDFQDGDDTENSIPSDDSIGSDENTSSEIEESETQSSFDDALDAERDLTRGDRVYAKVPFVDSDPFIIPIDKVNAGVAHKISRLHDDEQQLDINIQFRKFLKDSTKTVNYLAKEFEMKKNAEQYARANTSKTGVIDTNKLHSYKFNDDVFRRVTSLPGGKSHGLLMFVDWSGSMSNHMSNTIRQTMILAMFCRKVNIPFDVYSFTDGNSGEREDVVPDLKPGDINFSSDLSLRHYLTSDMRTKEFNDTLFHMFYLSLKFTTEYYWGGMGYDAMGSTPLNEAIIVADDVYTKFKTKHRLEKVNVVFLTDGAANTNRTVYDPDDEYGSKNMQLGWYHSQNSEPNTFVVDPKTKNSIGIVTDSSLTDSLLRHFGDRHSTNVIGMFISDANLRPVIELHINPENSKSYEEMTDINKSWRKERCLVVDHRGYSKFFVIKGGKKLTTDADDFVVDSDASKAKIRNAFKKHLTSKLGNKIILNSFIDIIS
tara:strand:- start:1137 stop:3254 length:2118 start_codon:yes stop_codon:yes gene_type:complete